MCLCTGVYADNFVLVWMGTMLYSVRESIEMKRVCTTHNINFAWKHISESAMKSTSFLTVALYTSVLVLFARCACVFWWWWKCQVNVSSLLLLFPLYYHPLNYSFPTHILMKASIRLPCICLRVTLAVLHLNILMSMLFVVQNRNVTYTPHTPRIVFL